MSSSVKAEADKRLKASPHQETSPTLLSLLKFLAISQADLANPEQVHKLEQLLETKPFKLGDSLFSYPGSETNESMGQGEHNAYDLHWVRQGRVRLLSYDLERRREVSIRVLEAGEPFGADHLFCKPSLAYRAIAASDGQIAQIPISSLQQWLQQIPNLSGLLQQQTQLRQRLLFFKTATSLRLFPSHKLQQLVLYIVDQHISAGDSLAQAASASAGRFWLRSGQVKSQHPQAQSPKIGASWGYPEAAPADWTAQTDLLVYRLPPEHWKAVSAVIPTLSSGLPPPPNSAAAQAPSSGRAEPPAPGQVQSPTPTGGKRSSPAMDPANYRQHPAKSEVAHPSRQTDPEQIAFPQPQPHRHRRRQFWQGYPFIQQQSTADCSAACLAMIGQYWGRRFSLNALRDLAGVGRSGASLKGLAQAAERLGFQARPVRASFNRLADRRNPWIAHWQGDHYVVVYRVRKNRIVIADPAMGRRTLSNSEFLTHWTGYALLLEPTAYLQSAEVEETQSLSRLIGVLSPYRALIFQIVLASLLIQIFGLLIPFFTQVILDRVVVQKSLITLHVFAFGLIMFGVWQVGLTAIRQYLLDYFSNRLDLTLISGFVGHALRLPLQFFASRHVGDITTRVQESQKLQRFLTRQVVIAWLDALMAMVYVGLMAYYNWRLTLLVLGLIPPIVILTLGATPLLRKVSREIFRETAQEHSTLVEMFTGIATIKATAAEREVRWRWEELLTSMLNARFRGQKLANNLQIASGLINSLGSTALLWYGAMLVIQDQLTIGQFVAFNMLLGHVINPILSVVKLWDEYQEVVISVERLNDVFSTQPEENPQKPMLALPSLKGEVRLENVTFRYGDDQERNTLQNISCHVRAGQTIAIVGRSGSGKSTLVNLLQGLYHPNSGHIWMDGHDIRHVSPQSLRSQLGVVPQECFLFSGTILENITLHRPEFTLEQVIEVAKLAEAHGFIQALPLGYQTKVGERGSTLSGGQRQRIAIARALLGAPPILVLDEATSSLDTESERRFQQNLAQISRDRTTFIIAHRLSTVRHADCILVLDRGILVEQGSHQELMSKQGLYCHLAQQQLDL
ncbi:MAG: cysteine peptidase family C39 domain-containing protein [Leptolyngbyaceae cyanobacterium MO_188.B28]|nr:cysteine peptidase family C39 domain-containing protein [Leptolyngbyaceae cyanobacterium MO_188.B28]